MVPRAQVERTEPPCSAQGVEAGIDPRERVAVFDGCQVQLAVVHAKTETTVTLHNHDDVAAPLRSTRTDQALAEKRLNLVVDGLDVPIRVASRLLPERTTVAGVHTVLDERRATRVIFSLRKHVGKAMQEIGKLLPLLHRNRGIHGLQQRLNVVRLRPGSPLFRGGFQSENPLQFPQIQSDGQTLWMFVQIEQSDTEVTRSVDDERPR